MRIFNVLCGFLASCADFQEVVRIFNELCGLPAAEKPPKKSFRAKNRRFLAYLAKNLYDESAQVLKNPHGTLRIHTTCQKSTRPVENPHTSFLIRIGDGLFNNCAEDAEPLPPFSPNREKRAYYPGCARRTHRLFRHVNPRSLKFRHSCITQKKRDITAHTPFRPQPRRNRPISRLRQDQRRTTSTSKSQIVGIPPFLHYTKEAGHNGAHPLSATTGKINRHLPIMRGTYAEQRGTRILKSSENDRF